MGRVFREYLDDGKIFACRQCQTHLSSDIEIVSKNFHGRSGKAYLFDKAVNVMTGPQEERKLMTGLHIVVDLFCNVCSSPVGWKYEHAHDEEQKYKEGKFILELAKTQRQ